MRLLLVGQTIERGIFFADNDLDYFGIGHNMMACNNVPIFTLMVIY